MERRTFIKLSGLTTIGLLAGNNVLAFTEKRDYKLIPIQAPKIHIRHGNFNLQSVNNGSFNIQRDIFTKDGSDKISTHRMVSIKIKDGKKETYGILRKSEIKNSSQQLSVIKLTPKKTSSIVVTESSVIFSESND